MVYYLHLKFESASLITPPLTKKGGLTSDKHIVREQNYIGQNYGQIKSREMDDFTHPIKLNQLSNMLHVMCNLPPVPSMRKSIFKVNEKVHETAKNSWIKYYNDLSLNEDGIPIQAELFQAAKATYNSELQRKTEFATFTAKGHFNWEFLRKHLEDKIELYNDLLTLFNTVLKCDNVISKYTFVEFIDIFSLKIKDEIVVDFVKNHEKLEKILSSPWYRVIFEARNGESNTSYTTKTPLFNTKGIKYKIVYDGEIIIKITDEDVIKHIKECGRIPTILDGGVVTVLGLTKYPPIVDFEKDYDKISQ